MSLIAKLIVGSGSRLISTRTIPLGDPSTRGGFDTRPRQPFSIQEPDPMSHDIDPQTGKITFQGQYTHDMTCIGNKFAVVGIAGGDALETFTFAKSIAPR